MINIHLGGRKITESCEILKSLCQEMTRDIMKMITPNKCDEYFERLLNEDISKFKAVKDN